MCLNYSVNVYTKYFFCGTRFGRKRPNLATPFRRPDICFPAVAGVGALLLHVVEAGLKATID